MCIFAALTARAIIFTALFVGETPWATFLCCLLLVHYQKILKKNEREGPVILAPRPSPAH